MHVAMHGSISPREADAMSFDDLIEVHRTLDAVDTDHERERAEMEANNGRA
jgi:hypothetical protein